MESFGRTISLVIGTIGVLFLLFFSKMISVRWQRHETVRNLTHAFAETLLRDGRFLVHEWETFQHELQQIGSYRMELTLYERRRFEDENGGFYLYEKTEPVGDSMLRAGSLVRMLVVPTEEAESKGLFWLGDYGAIVAGGRVR